MEKNRFLKILCYGTYVVGFQTMVIMDLWGMAFHAMVVIGLIPALLFISTWACCDIPTNKHAINLFLKQVSLYLSPEAGFCIPISNAQH